MARSFNGSGDVITCGSAAVTALPLTMCAWVNLNVTPTTNLRLVSNDDVAQTTLIILFYQLSTTSFGANCSGAVPFVTSAPAPPLNNNWYHLELTIDGSGNGTVYVNANAGTSGTGVGLTAPSAANRVLAGATNANVKIADVAIWNTVLTSGQLTSLANGVRPINVNSANLKLWLPLDGYASPETDLSGSGNNGTLTGTSRVLGPGALWRVSG